MQKFDNFKKMVDGKLYNPVDLKLFMKHLRAIRLCERFNKTSVINHFWRKHLLNKLIPSSKKQDLFIVAPFFCEYGVNIKIGKDVFFNADCKMLDVAPITIGDKSMFGVNVTLATPMHPLLADEREIKDYETGHHDLEYAKPITIGKNVWLASSVTVCGGVNIGDNCVIAAGSVVTRDIPSNCLAAGVPCRVIRELDEKDRLNVWQSYVDDTIPKSERAKEKENDEK